MEFRIADTFTDSLAKLTGAEQTAAKTTAFDLQINPSNPGLQFHRLEKAKDPNFWSVRVNQAIRVIVHRSEGSLLLCYVNHHDKAYQWAERRKLEIHPKTRAAQLVEIRETVKEIAVPKYVEIEQPKRPIFESVSDDKLLGYGIPPEWLADVHGIRDEDALLKLVEHLPAEASDALLIIADGGTPEIANPTTADPFGHPDALRRFRIMTNVEELKAALDYPWEKWAVFLHPSQRKIVEREYNGPARVAGTAGTGKTVVALHRAVHLARKQSDSRVLLTTFSSTLANSLKLKLRVLVGGEPRLFERIEVHSLPAIARRFYELRFGRPHTPSRGEIAGLITNVLSDISTVSLSTRFLESEWHEVIDRWNLKDWDSYRDVARLGRKTRLPEKLRSEAWGVFEKLRQELENRDMVTDAQIFDRLAGDLSGSDLVPFDFAIVDESQDINPSQLKFLASLGGDRANSLFFAGDLGQRIFQQAFSWLAFGVDIRGRSSSLKVNYRTTHQIRSCADQLLGPQAADVDGIVEDRRGTVSVFNGPAPELKVFDSTDLEIDAVSLWLKNILKASVAPHEVGIFVRTENELQRAQNAAKKAGILFKVLDHSTETTYGHVSLCMMHLAKGLEFRAVAVMACEDEIIPLQERIASVTDQADLEEVYNTERQLLYVACTRARDHLLITAAEHPSEFLQDLSPQT